MKTDWQHLTDLTGDKDFVVNRIQLVDTGVSIEGEFELPPLARLSYEDQVFVGEFVRSHGSIKHMEKAFGVSYPTIKGRLNRITERLQLVEVQISSDRDAILDQLERGEITAKEAVRRLKS